MSDWQRCVDWFLAKYCRCMLRLDWYWCRRRTSAKGHCRWGLQVWRRQVGFVQGTRWPVESSVSRMVARTARWSHRRFLGWAWKPRSSRDYVGAKSWVEIGGGYTEFAGFPVVHQKTTWFLGWSTKPRPKNRRRSCSNSRPVWPVGLTGLTGEEHRSDRCATTQSGNFKAEDTVGVLDRQPRGVPKVDERGLIEIGNSKEETRGTQFRQLWAVMGVIPYVLYAT
jgi:hypothetical protein